MTHVDSLTADVSKRNREAYVAMWDYNIEFPRGRCETQEIYGVIVTLTDEIRIEATFYDTSQKFAKDTGVRFCTLTEMARIWKEIKWSM